jgi:hypothetical protein
MERNTGGLVDRVDRVEATATAMHLTAARTLPPIQQNFVPTNYWPGVGAWEKQGMERRLLTLKDSGAGPRRREFTVTWDESSVRPRRSALIQPHKYPYGKETG